MGEAKKLIVKPIKAADANKIIKLLHYSGKIVPNSQLHFGVFNNGKCGGAMQFGPSTDKRRMLPLVRDTGWNEFMELNRMAFADWLPRNSESRCIAYAVRFIKKIYPHIKWIVSFADGVQCGDGAIYRASGFRLIGIKKNNQILKMPDGTINNKKTLDTPNHVAAGGRFGSALAREQGAVALGGFQLKYIYFIDPSARERLTVPILPFSEIDKMGARMYKGKASPASIEGDAVGDQPTEGSSILTAGLHND